MNDIEQIDMVTDAMHFIEDGKAYRAYATLAKLLEDLNAYDFVATLKDEGKEDE